uniref:EF-hand domain-containing protein n=1 Tax=Rhabditophanes sp. KR3021 TaxID=114890 RepID=A0AC35U7K5_9BILA
MNHSIIVIFCVSICFITSSLATNDSTSTTTALPNITPIPMESLNPRLKEFRRIDQNKDDRLTFTEYLLGDRSYLEQQSRNYHNLDTNADGTVTREEFITFFKKQDEVRKIQALQADNFFKQFQGPTLLDNGDNQQQGPNNGFNFPNQGLFNLNIPQQNEASTNTPKKVENKGSASSQ